MNSGTVSSGLTGLALAPLFASIGHLALEVTAAGSGARLLCVLAAGGCAAVLGRLPRPASARPLAGLAWLASAVIVTWALLVYAPYVPAAVVVVPVALATLGLGASGARLAAGPGALLLGWALGSVALEAWVVPAVGFLPPLVASVIVLPLVAGRVPERAPAVGPSRGLMDLGLLGLLGAFTLELARPFVLQHLGGARASHVVLLVVLLVGLGLGASVPVPRRLRPAARLVAPLLFLAGLAMCWRTLLNMRGGMALPDEDVRLVELRVAQLALGVAAITAGWWLRVGWEVVVSSGARRPACAGLASLLLAAAIGMAVANSTLARFEELPAVAAGALDDLVRRGPHEMLDDRVVTSDGVLRRIRDIAHPEYGDGLAWHGRRVSNVPAFARLERAELSFPRQLALGCDRMLVIGSLSEAHAAALDDEGELELLEVRPVLPSLDPFEARVAERDLAADDDGFDVTVVLSTPFLSREAARALSTARLGQLARRSRVLVVWFDLRAVAVDVVAATAGALAETAGDVRAWIAMDGYQGPLLALSCGGAGRVPEPGGDAIVQPFPLPELAVGRDAGVFFPAAELGARLGSGTHTLAPWEALDVLARTAAEADQGTLAGALSALAIHADEYFDVELAVEANERDRLTDAEVDALARIAARAPDDALVIHQLRAFAQLAYDKAEYERLLVAVEPLLAAVDDPELLAHAARTHFQLLDDASAIDLLERALANGLDDAATLVLLGRAYTRAGDPLSATAVLEMARSREPTDSATCRSLGLALAAVGRRAEALPYLEGVAAQFPADEELQAVLEALR